MDAQQRIAVQFANQLLMSRLPVGAAESIHNDAISAAATSRYRALMSVAPQAVALLRRQTAPPGIAVDVVREMNGRDQAIKIVPAQPQPEITQTEIDQMAVLIATAIQAASAASAAADALCTDQITP